MGQVGVEVLLTVSELSLTNSDEAEDDSCTIVKLALLEVCMELFCGVVELHAAAEKGKTMQHTNAINLCFIHVISYFIDYLAVSIQKRNKQTACIFLVRSNR